MRAHGANVQHAATNGTDKGDMIFFERLLNKLIKSVYLIATRDLRISGCNFFISKSRVYATF